jgi:hypothetical protein
MSQLAERLQQLVSVQWPAKSLSRVSRLGDGPETAGSHNFALPVKWPSVFVWGRGRGANLIHRGAGHEQTSMGELFTMRCGLRMLWQGDRLAGGDASLPRCEECR